MNFLPVSYVRITSVPPGEAPLWVREQWIGLLLPLAQPQAAAVSVATTGVLSGPKSFLPALAARVMGRYERQEGYLVDGATAISVLVRSSPEAAMWWQQNTPQLLQPGFRLVFQKEVGYVCEG